MLDKKFEETILYRIDKYQNLFNEKELKFFKKAQENELKDLFVYLETPISNYFTSEDLMIIDNLQNQYPVQFSDYQETIRLFHRRKEKYVIALKKFYMIEDYKELRNAYLAMQTITKDLIGIIQFFQDKQKNPTSKETFTPEWKLKEDTKDIEENQDSSEESKEPEEEESQEHVYVGTSRGKPIILKDADIQRMGSEIFYEGIANGMDPIRAYYHAQEFQEYWETYDGDE